MIQCRHTALKSVIQNFQKDKNLALDHFAARAAVKNIILILNKRIIKIKFKADFRICIGGTTSEIIFRLY